MNDTAQHATNYDLAAQAALQLTTEDKERLVAHILGGEDFDGPAIGVLTHALNVDAGNLSTIFTSEDVLTQARETLGRDLTDAEEEVVAARFDWGNLDDLLSERGNDYVAENIDEALAQLDA